MKALTSNFIMILIGACAVSLSLLIERYFFDSLNFATTFWMAAIEEGLKFIPLIFLKKDKSFLWKAVMIGLGFGIIEGILFMKVQIPDLFMMFTVFAGRTVGGIMLHILTLLISAIVLYKKPNFTIFAIVLATVLHALWNLYIANGNMGLMWFAEIIFVLTWFVFVLKKRFIHLKLLPKEV